MRIVLASSEAVPFSKTGGLADVASALAKALADAGHDVSIITPHYPQALAKGGSQIPPIEPTGRTIEAAVGAKRVTAAVLRSTVPKSRVPVFLIDRPAYYDRPGLYGDNGTDYKDNCERFVFFSRAVMETARQFDLRPEILHANDWQTGLLPALLRVEYRKAPEFGPTRSVFTIHNMAFQGRFWHWDMVLTGLDWKYFNWRQMEFFDHLNLLKTGVVFADKITTVSPGYAREIRTPEFGHGMHGVLQERGADLVGILNGADTEIWNPATDPALPKNYSAETVGQGKPVCKEHLQRLVGLEVRRDLPLFGMISRMTDQKGFDLIAECADRLLSYNIQLCFLGTGDERYERLLKEFARRRPQRIAARIGFDEPLAHQIEAGADAFLMPSRFEPCGLNQMYSLIYGTVPVVRSVGGLADTVVDATEQNISAGRATGFVFKEYTSDELLRQVRRAVEIYRQKEQWKRLIQTGMRQDWSWKRSAAEYVGVYEQALSKSSGRANTS